MKKKTVLIAVIAVLCLGIGIAFLFLKGMGPNTNGTEELTAPPVPPAESTPMATHPGVVNEDNEKKYTVAFFDSFGYLLKEEQVGQHESAVPPDEFVPVDDKIFIGWDKDFSFIFSDINIRPNYLDISNDKNYVYANAQYAKPGQEICVRVKLGGQVSLAALQMYISYDGELLEYIGAANADAGVMVNKDDQKDQIRLAFLADDNVTGTVEFADLNFVVKGNSGDKAVIMYDIEKAAMISADNEIVPADYTVKDTVIHIY